MASRMKVIDERSSLSKSVVGVIGNRFSGTEHVEAMVSPGRSRSGAGMKTYLSSSESRSVDAQGLPSSSSSISFS